MSERWKLNLWSAAIAAGVLLAPLQLAAQALATADAKAAPAANAMDLKVGDMAPDFKLRYFDGAALKDVSLADYRGKKNVALAFYVFAFTGG